VTASRLLLVTFVAVSLLFVAVPGTASAASGTTVVDLGGKGLKGLRAQKVKVVAKRPARLSRGKLRLPVSEGLVTSSAYISHRGGLVLRRGTRKLAISKLQVRLGKSSRVDATVGRKRMTLFSLRARGLSLNAANGSASVRGAKLVLARGAARAIKRSLRLERLPRGAFGGATVDALVTGSGGAGGGGGGGGGGGPDGPPSSRPVGDEPPVLARPAGAANVTGAQVEWHVKPSWIRYINTGNGTTPFAGASNGSTTPECGEASEPPLPLVYSFHFPFASGWYEAASGSAAVYFGGGVNFKYSLHGIDLDTKEPEIEINGAQSRAIFRFDGRDGTAVANKRAVLVDLDVAAAPPSIVGNTVTYTKIPGTIPQGGAESVFAGFYAPGERFGCVTVSFTT
jgi:Htaa protein